MQIIELEMGPSGAMDLLDLGNSDKRPRPITVPFRGGNYLHYIKGYNGGSPVRKRKWMKNYGVGLYAIGIPDQLDFENGVVVEFKTYSDPLDIPYHVERGIFQCCFYCWMLGFRRFGKFRILLYNTDTDAVDIVIEKKVDRFKFFKKLRTAIRLGVDDLKKGRRIHSRKKPKPVREYYWLIRAMDRAFAPKTEPCLGSLPENSPKIHCWLMEHFEEMVLS